MFGNSSLLQVSTAVRRMGNDATSMEEVATELVTYLRDYFVDKELGTSALPLVRCYVTQRRSQLEPALQDYALAAGVDAFADRDVVCLTLLATAGEKASWNDRRASVGHRAIPLPSVATLSRLPMVAQLVKQLGVDPQHLVEPDPALFRNLEERQYNVFFVQEAHDSPFIPDQDNFVIPYGIRSVLGFGGALPHGELFAVILFSSVSMPPTAVDTFAPVALSAKLSFLSLVGHRVFSDAPVLGNPSPEPGQDLTLLESRVGVLSQLLDVRANVVESEARRIEEELVEARRLHAEAAETSAALALSEARKTAILEGSLDCIIGMDAKGHITEFNRAAESTFGCSRTEVIGSALADLFIPAEMRERHRLGLRRLVTTGEGPILNRRIELSALRHDGTEFPVELTVTQVEGADPPLFSGYLRDITTSRQATAELAAGQERLAHIARTLQTSLLPPSLPTIDGFDLAAAYRAHGDGYEVGGDFYDVFELGDGKWGIALGDVCGKGSEAAAITALARYTLRAAAMRSGDPAEVLEILNEALYRQGSGRFCTVAYAVLDSTLGELLLSLGGHPPPLLSLPGGHVISLGTPGLLLGVFHDWHGTTDAIALNAGSSVLFYSDGVTEARSVSKFFGDERLKMALREGSGTIASEIVKKIETDVLTFADGLSDDFALLAIERR